MGYRGRLINKFVAVIRRVDVDSIRGAGDYDDDFRIVKKGQRVEMDALRIPCQLDRRTWGRDVKTPSGHEIEADIILTLHYPDLERLSLLDANGVPVLKQKDRIEAIETRTGVTEVEFPNPPGMFIVHQERAGHGLAAFGTPRTNLWVLYCAFDSKSREHTL
jgi:hypothetical protein